jgi:hypothetical protein
MADMRNQLQSVWNRFWFYAASPSKRGAVIVHFAAWPSIVFWAAIFTQGAERHKDASRIGLRTAQAGMISARTNGDKRRYAAKTSF